MADVATDIEIKQQLLTFIVVGAGFSGVETAAEVNELIRRALKYYPNIKKHEIKVMLVEYADRILMPTFPTELEAHATRRLKIHGIDLGTGVGTKTPTSTATAASTPPRHHRSCAEPTGADTQPQHAMGPNRGRPLHARPGARGRAVGGRRGRYSARGPSG
jgi:hypothetical protein